MLGRKIDPFTRLLFLDLYRVALVDGILSQDELKMLYNIGQQKGVSIEEIQEIIRNPTKTPCVKVKDFSKRQYLVDITKIIVADTVITEEELYLWDRIAERVLGKTENLEQIKESVFKDVVTEFIKSESNKLKKVEKQLRNELKEKIFTKGNNIKFNKKTIDKQDPLEITDATEEVDQVETCSPLNDNEGTTDTTEIDDKSETTDTTYPVKEPPRILFVGTFNQTKQQIKTIFRQVFIIEDITLSDRRSFFFAIDKDYKNVKRINKNKIQNASNGFYDLIIYGPHPHHIPGNDGKSWDSILKDTDTIYSGDYNKTLSDSSLKDCAESFLGSWISTL